MVPRICELVRYYCKTLREGRLEGPAALATDASRACPLASLPVREVISGVHIRAISPSTRTVSTTIWPAQDERSK